eukprot:1207975-Alexandrium_andersonii.AAC.1
MQSNTGETCIGRMAATKAATPTAATPTPTHNASNSKYAQAPGNGLQRSQVVRRGWQPTAMGRRQKDKVRGSTPHAAVSA